MLVILQAGQRALRLSTTPTNSTFSNLIERVTTSVDSRGGSPFWSSRGSSRGSTGSSGAYEPKPWRSSCRLLNSGTDPRSQCSPNASFDLRLGHSKAKQPASAGSGRVGLHARLCQDDIDSSDFALHAQLLIHRAEQRFAVEIDFTSLNEPKEGPCVAVKHRVSQKASQHFSRLAVHLGVDHSHLTQRR